MTTDLPYFATWDGLSVGARDGIIVMSVVVIASRVALGLFRLHTQFVDLGFRGVCR